MTREENRLRFPYVAMLMDSLRAGGITARVVYANEGGNEAGNRARHDEWDRAIPWEPAYELYQADRRRYGRRR